MKKYVRVVFASIFCFCANFLKAQNIDTIGMQKNANGEISFAHVSNAMISNAKSFLKSTLQASDNDSFVLEKEDTDELGMIHLRYQQYYKGIKVENAEYMLHGKNGNIETMNGDFQLVNIASVTPTLSEKQALSEALNYVNAREYKWQDSASENSIKKITNDPNATYYPKGELVIERDYLKGGKNLLLSWKFSISSLVPNNEQLVYVDANTGRVINLTPEILDANTPLTAQTMYSGTLGITGDSYSGGYRLRETRNGVTIETLNLNGGSIYSNATDFTNNNISWTVGSWPAIAQDQQALDAHLGAENVLDFWKNIFNRNSLNGNGLSIMSYVHNPIGNNAYWDANAHVMNYGDGDGIVYNPLTALDICAHEMGHGINEFTANLTAGTQESGALNEGFSDIWGASIEHWAAPAKQTWRIGEEIFIGGIFDCIRNLQNPKDNQTSEGQHPDTYQGNFWDPNGEPHTNSTVLSHWYYLLSQGGTGTNDLSDSYNVGGIGISDAEKIAWRTESVYLTSSANYAAARTASIQAATDLFGANSCQTISTTNAWYAVGVGAAYSGIAGMSISGDDLVCGTSNPYSVNSLLSGSSITWSGGSLVTINSPNSLQTTITKLNNSGMALLTADVLACQQSQHFYVVKPVKIGPPNINTLIPTYSTDGYNNWLQDNNCLKTYNFPGMYSGQVSLSDTVATSFTWTFVSKTPSTATATIGYSDPRYATITVKPSGASVTYKLTVSNSCGSYSHNYSFTANGLCGGLLAAEGSGFTLTPNPASGNVTVSMNISNTSGISNNASTAQSLIYAINVADGTGTTRKSFSYQGVKSASISLSGFISGTYTISVYDGQGWQSQQLVVQK